MDQIETAYKVIAERQFDKLDDLWTEMILDGKQTIENLLAVTAELKKIKETDHALMLLEMLASQLELDKKYRQSIEVYKAMLYYHAEDPMIREKLIELYRRSFSGDVNLDEYLHLSGITTGEPIIKALARLNEFLKFTVGQQFFFEKYGLGTVIEALPRQYEIVIDFEKVKRHFIKIDVAKGLLMPINQDHFLSLKRSNPEKLKTMFENDPAGLVKKIIMDWPEPLTASGIKNLLEGILAKGEIDSLWDRVKKELDTDPGIKTEGRSTKTYRYIADTRADNQAILQQFEKALPQDKYRMAKDIARHTPDLLSNVLTGLIALGNSIYEKDPSLALHIFLFAKDHDLPGDFQYSLGSMLRTIEPAQLINGMSEIEHKKVIVGIVKEMAGAQWIEEFKKKFLILKDPALLDHIDDLLKKVNAAEPALYQQILTLPKNYPDQYKWLLKKMIDGTYRENLIPALVPRIIQSSDFIKGTKLTIQKLLNMETFDQIIKSASADDAVRIYNALMTSPIDEHHKKGLIRIIEYHHAGIFQKQEDVIYTTEASLKLRQAELQHLLAVEIHANKKDISRGREFGDLSDNFEYKSAKENTDKLYAKIRLIEDELKKTRLIKSGEIDINKVSIETRVIMEDINQTNSIHYTILGRWDTDLNKNIIANEAPIARH